MQDKNTYQAELFSNRLKKKYKELRKWARKNSVSSYRLYDRDIPEIPLSLDVYEFLPDGINTPELCEAFIKEQNARISANDMQVEKEIEERRYAVLYLYERPYEKPAEEEAEWFVLMAENAARVLNIAPDHIIKKERKQQKGLSQYEKSNAKKITEGFIQEKNLIFKIDLTSYLDTGLFFDHRPLRSIVEQTAESKRVLNLFCYTGSFSVYAARGNAAYVESVDLSNTYLSWAEDNMKKNTFRSKEKYVFTKADVIGWLEKKSQSLPEDKKFDIIVLDPPTFSNSKSTENVLDINRDWPELVKNAVSILKPNGILYFSTNSTRLSFDAKLLPKNTDWKDMTSESIPKDFEGTKCHRLWKIQLF